jgi:hypothetical protein
MVGCFRSRLKCGVCSASDGIPHSSSGWIEKKFPFPVVFSEARKPFPKDAGRFELEAAWLLYEEVFPERFAPVAPAVWGWVHLSRP